ncbi:hypothetical protein [Streptomyces zaehneri]|nr:hypothetical protein [Streptomyces sp. DSM 40713]
MTGRRFPVGRDGALTDRVARRPDVRPPTHGPLSENPQSSIQQEK